MTSWPRTIWKYSGIRIMPPNMAAPRLNVVTDVAAKAGWRTGAHPAAAG
jgi:hypothetical protein